MRNPRATGLVDEHDSGERGAVTAPFVATVALTLLLVVLVANVLVVRYAEGVVQAAVEVGARHGLATGSAAACEARIDDAVRGGLGAMSLQVGPPVCTLGGDGVTARLEAGFAGWLPAVGDHTTSVRATARGVRPP